MLLLIKDKFTCPCFIIICLLFFNIQVSATTIQTQVDGKAVSMIHLNPGDSVTIEALMEGAVSSKTMRWISYNPEIAAIKTPGIVTGKNEGTTKIRVFLVEESNVYKDIVIKVAQLPEITGIHLPAKKIEMQVYQTMQLTVNFLPTDQPMPADGKIIWTCENMQIALVEDNGFVTALNEGVASVTCHYDQNGKRYSEKMQISVYRGLIPVTSIETPYKKVKMIKDQTFTFSAKLLPEKANNRNVFVSAGNTDIVRVEHNTWIFSENAFTVYGLAPGTTMITATSEDGGYKTSFEITVEENSSRGGGKLAQGVTPNQGWFDCNKEWGGRDSTTVNGIFVEYLSSDNSLCWAATAANIIDWWQASIGIENVPTEAPRGASVNKDGSLKPSDNSSYSQSNVYEYFRMYSASGGYYVEKGLNWYFTGSESLEFTANWDKGFRYKDYEGFGSNRHVASCVDFFMDKGREFYIKEFKQSLMNTIDKGTPAGLNIIFPNGGGHAITVWGYELADYDFVATGSCPNEDLNNNLVKEENLNSRNGDHLIAYIYITDSDDGNSPNKRPSGPTRPSSLIRVPVFYRDTGLYTITAKNCNTFARIMSLSIFNLKYGDVPRLK